jgi:membrane protein implicated in regulation of membrane protease activity
MFIPALFMTVTTEAALAYQTFWVFVPHAQWPLAIIAVVLMLLGLLVAYEVFIKFRLSRNHPTRN